ncbi:MAG TPA: hypothetical protein VGL97_24385 [Bryobacteraceae bacterium]|jgi:hypothetical protein
METTETVIENGIKLPIRLLLQERHYVSALILIYSGIETMALINLPLQKADVMRSDFILWVESYLLPFLPQEVRLTGKDIYGARCGVLRGTDSRLAREGHCRKIRYKGAGKDASVLSVEELANAFFQATDEFVSDSLRNDKRAAFEARLKRMVENLPF